MNHAVTLAYGLALLAGAYLFAWGMNILEDRIVRGPRVLKVTVVAVLVLALAYFAGTIMRSGRGPA